ncbi:hypothetical protein LR48_Vigan727s000600 [Vigna angularis]|uniref:Uncharacterized protein n=2 Tax=Phaseolus angularis TaxID=3914 RepID=A0A0L9TGH4_PHAAN|nr:hypothetical protein LR48_Vigan727s000600 [Vigna angularis]BAT75571.1 hypothetical protein VIGAN_01344900 [Vigna angularis var. angularis]
MVKFQTLQKYLFIFLALVACHGFLLAHGRKINIKALKQHLPPLKTNFESPHYEKSRKLEDSGAGSTKTSRPITPVASRGVGHEMITSEDHNTMKSEGPGHSPGVGHAYHQKKIGQEN